jgi:hypothetical protein
MDSVEPLLPPETDCRDIDGFLLNVEKLMASELWALATAEELRAALALWCRAWKQVPAASLPDDDRVLAAFSGAGARWPKLREMALRSFIKCNDGRLYHPVLAAEAVKAYEAKLKFRKRRDVDAERLRKWREKRDGNAFRNTDGNALETVSKVREGKVREVREEDTPVAKAPGDGSYAFVGSVIRLTKRDFEKWRSAYSAITDLKAELQGIDDWLHGQPEDKRRRWFHAVSGMLSRKHQELAAAQPKPALTTHDVRWENTVRLWIGNRKWYPDVDGPPPDHPQTRVPREILKIFNIQPEQS